MPTSDLQNGGTYILGDSDAHGNAWLNITVRNSTFTDYVNYKRRWLSKTIAMSGSYIRTKQNNQYGAAQSTGRLVVTDCMFDEGAHTAIVATNTPYVELRGVSVNLNSTAGSTAVRLTNVKHATINQSVADWSQNGRPFLTTQNVKFLKLSGLELRAGNTFWHNLGNTNMQIEYCEECSRKPYVGDNGPQTPLKRD